MTYTDVFGSATLPPAEYGYASFTLTTNTTFVWPYNTDGSPYPVAKVMDIACDAGNEITLPDCTEVSTGEDFLVRNVGANALIVKDAAGVQVASVAVGAASYFYLTDNTSAAGVFGVIGFGVGTSTADASSLVGYGIKAVGASLNQAHPVQPTNTGITLSADHRAKLVVFTGGVASFTLDTAATLGDDYFTMFRNDGTGTATIDPAASELIDGMTSMQVQPGESLMLICTGTKWYSVGYGRSTLYQFTQLTKDVSAGGTITLSATEAASKLITFIGNPTAAVDVVVPAVVAVYYTQSAISTAQTVTLKTSAGSGVGISQGARVIALCDGTNVVSAQSAVANTSVSLTDGSALVPSLFFATQTNTGLFKSGTRDVGVTVGGSAVAVFGSTGLQTTTIGPNSTQRHTLPAVPSDTVTLNTATQTLTNKTLTAPVVNSPTGITKADVGLGNVDNTSDADKPVSTATQAALNAQQNSLLSSSGSSLVGYLPAGTGAVATNVQTKLREFVSVKDFGAVGDGVADDTAALQNAINYAKSISAALHLSHTTYKTSVPLDISGVSIVGLAKGYRNADGTVITGSGGHDILIQATATADDTRIDLHNLRIKGGVCGIKVRYMLHSHWSNVHVTDCTDGVQFGNSSDAGGLFNTFDNIEVDVTGTALDVNGNGFVNANSFNQCLFKGGNYGARVRCTGGLGAVANVFNCCEFLGDRYGVELDNTSNTVFNQPYFESIGPAVSLIGNRNIGWTINNPVFALLENTNPTGKNAYIYHAGSGTQRGTISGGYVYIPAASKYNNLSLVASELPASFYLVMEDQPEYDVSATGFTVLNGLYSPNLIINESKSFTPVWTAATANPSLGNGTLTGYYSRSGNTVNATITLTAGSTTTFGTGAWSFSLPYAVQNKAVGQAFILDSGTGYFGGVVMVNDNDTTAEVYISGTANLLSSTAPMVWAVNDSITITISYRA